MIFKLSEPELRIISVLNNSPTIGELTKHTSVTAGYISRVVASLKHKGFVEVSTRGITKKVKLSNNLHAVKLKAILQKRSYMPLPQLLQGSGILVLAVLSTGKADLTRLIDESQISEATLRRHIRKFKKQAMLLYQNKEYELPQDLTDINEFLKDYCSYFAVSTLQEISPQGRFISSHGFEFLFASDMEVKQPNVRPTGLTVISGTIPLILAENYYFYSMRKLSYEEIAAHAIAADPHSKRNLAYVLMYMLKTKPDKDLFLRISNQYGIARISKSMADLLDTWKQPEEKFMPSPSYIKQKAEEYNIKWQE